MPKKRRAEPKAKKTKKPVKRVAKKGDDELSLEELDHVSGGVGIDLSVAGPGKHGAYAPGKLGAYAPIAPGPAAALGPYVPILASAKSVK